MAGPGRRPVPSHLKLIRGNPGRRPINPNEPKPVGELVDPPNLLDREQRQIWKHAINHAPPGVLTKLDMSALVVWVVACSLWQRAVRAQNAADAAALVAGCDLSLTTTTDGSAAQSPYLAIINRQARMMLKAAGELGFTPASRNRIDVPFAPARAGNAAPDHLT